MNYFDSQYRNRAMCVVAAVMAAGVYGCTAQVDPASDVASTSDPIWAGDSAAANLAVVEVTRSGASGICSGYFITARHIVTSAHCTDPSYVSQWYRIRIKTGYGTFAELKDANRTDNWVLLTEDTVPGFDFNNQLASTDMAILTLPSTTWSSVPSAQQFLRVSTASAYGGQALGIWGWGARYASDTAPPGDLLSGNGGAQISVSSVATGSFSAQAYSNARTCKGDSGGPATRYYSGNYIAVGTHRGADTVGCADYGATMFWSDVANKTAWIESILRTSFGAGFSCTRYASGLDAYMRCF